MNRFLARCALILAVLAPLRSARADGTAMAAGRAFDERVAPIFARHCLECHGATVRKGGLSLATEKAARKGGDSGPAVEPRDPEASLLWEQITSGSMPKGRPRLSDDEKARLRTWIADGARWGTPEIDPFSVTTDRRAGYDWWSLRPVRSLRPRWSDRTGRGTSSTASCSPAWRHGDSRRHPRPTDGP